MQELSLPCPLFDSPNIDMGYFLLCQLPILSLLSINITLYINQATEFGGWKSNANLRVI